MQPEENRTRRRTHRKTHGQGAGGSPKHMSSMRDKKEIKTLRAVVYPNGPEVAPAPSALSESLHRTFSVQANARCFMGQLGAFLAKLINPSQMRWHLTSPLTQWSSLVGFIIACVLIKMDFVDGHRKMIENQRNPAQLIMTPRYHFSQLHKVASQISKAAQVYNVQTTLCTPRNSFVYAAVDWFREATTCCSKLCSIICLRCVVVSILLRGICLAKNFGSCASHAKWRAFVRCQNCFILIGST